MPPLTIYLSRLLGLLLLVIAATEFSQGAAMLTAAAQIFNDLGLLLITGLLTAAAGLAIVVGHNVWRGGAMPVIVTVLGWLMLLKGLGLLVVPATGWMQVLSVSRYAQFYPAYGAVALVLGAYLTFAGFSARRAGQAHNS